MPQKTPTARGQAMRSAFFALLVTTALVLFAPTESHRAIIWWHLPIYFLGLFLAYFALLRLTRPKKRPSENAERP
jgi:hypothetical protein